MFEESTNKELTRQANEITILQMEVKNLKEGTKPVSVTVTAYSPRLTETDDTPFTTAFMTAVKPGTIAVSRDLFLDGWIPGRKVYIYRVGVFTISDLMHHRKQNQLDIFFPSTSQAIQFGVKKSRAILLNI